MNEWKFIVLSRTTFINENSRYMQKDLIKLKDMDLQT